MHVSIFYESLCPDSIRFIKNQLEPNYHNFAPYITIDFIPFGKSKVCSNRLIAIFLNWFRLIDASQIWFFIKKTFNMLHLTLMGISLKFEKRKKNHQINWCENNPFSEFSSRRRYRFHMSTWAWRMLWKQNPFVRIVTSAYTSGTSWFRNMSNELWCRGQRLGKINLSIAKTML